MKLIRTRIVVAVASSAVLAGGFGLTAIALGSAAQSTVTVAAQQSNSQCPNTTIIDYCSQR